MWSLPIAYLKGARKQQVPADIFNRPTIRISTQLNMSCIAILGF